MVLKIDCQNALKMMNHFKSIGNSLRYTYSILPPPPKKCKISRRNQNPHMNKNSLRKSS